MRVSDSSAHTHPTSLKPLRNEQKPPPQTCWCSHYPANPSPFPRATPHAASELSGASRPADPASGLQSFPFCFHLSRWLSVAVAVARPACVCGNEAVGSCPGAHGARRLGAAWPREDPPPLLTPPRGPRSEQRCVLGGPQTARRKGYRWPGRPALMERGSRCHFRLGLCKGFVISLCVPFQPTRSCPPQLAPAGAAGWRLTVASTFGVSAVGAANGCHLHTPETSAERCGGYSRFVLAAACGSGSVLSLPPAPAGERPAAGHGAAVCLAGPGCLRVGFSSSGDCSALNVFAARTSLGT